jgi:hypothetical protein
MPSLPAQPDLDHLRRQAKDLLRAAQAGDTAATARIRAVSDELTLAAAQLTLARKCGFASWPRLKGEVDARTLGLAEKADGFIQASISGNTRRAARMLEETSALAGYSFATAVILGDAERVSAELQQDRGSPEPTSSNSHEPRSPSLPPRPRTRSRQLQQRTRGAERSAHDSLLSPFQRSPFRIDRRRLWMTVFDSLRCLVALDRLGDTRV